MIVRESRSATFRRRLDEALESLPPFTHMVLAGHVQAMPSDLVRWADGRSMPFDHQRSQVTMALNDFLTWPDDVFSHIVLLVRVCHPELARQLHDHLDVTAEELLQWADAKNLPDDRRRAAIMELLKRVD